MGAAIETDDASSFLRFDRNLLAYGSTDSWLGHSITMDSNLLVRVDLSGTDNPTVDSPTCVWSLFNSSYWQPFGGGNLSFNNNTCISFAGDMYTYGFYPSHERSDGRRAGLESTAPVGSSGGSDIADPVVPPPFIHSNCDPAFIAQTAWASTGNRFLSAQQPPSVNCGSKTWPLASWQASGRDVGSSAGPMPSAAAVHALGTALLWDPT